ncbi:MAG: T9SS type A sorting domain-containing protein [Ignavibacteriae bacterium]|nr:T9SS type A sorting domain-containing protein [Ignavibacteriota bacterium]
MRKFYLLFFVFYLGTMYSQTSLNPGDIAVIMNQTDAPDDFAFVTFVDLAAGTVIYFTDCGADASGFATPCTEGAVSYTVASSGLSQGSIVVYSQSSSNFSVYNDSRITGTFATSTAGDQVIVFQDNNNPGGSSNAGNNPKFIFASNTASSVFTGDKNNNNETGLPNGLSDTITPRTALGLGLSAVANDETDNAVYNGSYNFPGQTINDAKIALTNPDNYVKSDLTSDSNYASAVSSIPSSITFNTLSTKNYSLNEIKLYPNPSTGLISIANLTNNTIEKVELIDQSGRSLVQDVMENKKLMLDVPSGTYFIRITSDVGIVVKKLVIN